MDKRWLAAALLAASPLASAQASGLNDRLRALIEQASSSVPARIEVEFPHFEVPPAIAQCQRLDPFVPPGAKVWGRTRIGVRCTDAGSTATALVPVVVHAYVEGMVATRPLPAGATLTAADLATGEVDAAAAPGALVTDVNQALGRALARALPAGAALRAEALRPLMAIQAGETVRVVYAGTGFSVSMDGRALSAAPDGQGVRVQTDAGKVVTGTARPGRLVEIKAPAGAP